MGSDIQVHVIEYRDRWDEVRGPRLWAIHNGRQMLGRVRDAIRRGERRWRDPEYLARVIFDEMTRDAHGGLDGFGISIGSNQCRTLEVDVPRQEVRTGSRVWSFAEFASLEGDLGHLFEECPKPAHIP